MPFLSFQWRSVAGKTIARSVHPHYRAKALGRLDAPRNGGKQALGDSGFNPR